MRKFIMISAVMAATTANGHSLDAAHPSEITAIRENGNVFVVANGTTKGEYISCVLMNADGKVIGQATWPGQEYATTAHIAHTQIIDGELPASAKCFPN